MFGSYLSSETETDLKLVLTKHTNIWSLISATAEKRGGKDKVGHVLVFVGREESGCELLRPFFFFSWFYHKMTEEGSNYGLKSINIIGKNRFIVPESDKKTKQGPPHPDSPQAHKQQLLLSINRAQKGPRFPLAEENSGQWNPSWGRAGAVPAQSLQTGLSPQLPNTERNQSCANPHWKLKSSPSSATGWVGLRGEFWHLSNTKHPQISDQTEKKKSFFSPPLLFIFGALKQQTTQRKFQNSQLLWWEQQSQTSTFKGFFFFFFCEKTSL